MLQRLLDRRILDLGGGPGAERSAGRGEDDPDQFLAAAGAHRLKQRVVLGIHRQHAGAGLRGARMNTSPAQTRHSLLASATVTPRSAAAIAGFSPAAPLIAAITQFAGRCGRLDHRAFAGADGAVPASASFNSS